MHKPRETQRSVSGLSAKHWLVLATSDTVSDVPVLPAERGNPPHAFLRSVLVKIVGQPVPKSPSGNGIPSNADEVQRPHEPRHSSQWVAGLIGQGSSMEEPSRVTSHLSRRVQSQPCRSRSNSSLYPQQSVPGTSCADLPNAPSSHLALVAAFQLHRPCGSNTVIMCQPRMTRSPSLSSIAATPSTLGFTYSDILRGSVVESHVVTAHRADARSLVLALKASYPTQTVANTIHGQILGGPGCN